MAKNNNLTDFLTGVANAIRAKKGTTDLINPQDFESQIASIETGGRTNKLPQVVDKTVTEITAEDLQGATTIGNAVFASCSSLTSITIPDSVTIIGGSAFNGCRSLTSVMIGSSITSIGGSAFASCSSLTSITIPNKVISISNDAFNGCRSLTSVTIGNSVTNIGSSAFAGCSSLTSITIPDSVTSIAYSALRIGSATNKATIAFKSTSPPSIQSSTFNADYLNKIIVPAGTGDTYKAATNWSAFADYIEEAAE